MSFYTKYFLSAVFLIFSVISCSEKIEVSGHYMDSQGLSILSVAKTKDGKWTVGNPTGMLEGTLEGSTITGKTQLGDSFSMEILGDSAIYTIMGIPTAFLRITDAKYRAFYTGDQ